MREINPERSTVRRELFDVDHLQTVPARELIDCYERKVREVLVVDGVELILHHQAGQMREFQRHDTFGLQEPGYAGDEVIEIRNLGQNVVANDGSAFLPSPPMPPQGARRSSRLASQCPCQSPPWQHSPPARCRAPGCPVRKCCKRYPSLLASSTTRLSAPSAVG